MLRQRVAIAMQQASSSVWTSTSMPWWGCSSDASCLKQCSTSACILLLFILKN